MSLQYRAEARQLGLPKSRGQVPLRQALEFTSPRPGSYTIQVPSSLCFGIVAHGGLLMAFVHKAAVDFASKNPKSASHQHVQQISVNFFRPTQPAPQEEQLTFKVASGNKAWTVLQYEISQGGKLCIAGYLTLADLSAPGTLSVKTNWALSPAPLPTTVESLEADHDPNWVSYSTPFEPEDFRRPQSYMKCYIPTTRTAWNTLDQWMTPGWKETQSSPGAVWTNETIHFVIDNVVPLLNDLVYGSSPKRPSMYENMIKAGLAQRQARDNGEDDKIVGEGLDRIEHVYPWSASTISMTTEIKKALPVEGTKWLFMRVTAKSVKSNRMDYEIVLMDAEGELVAVSQQVLQVIPVGKKTEVKKAML